MKMAAFSQVVLILIFLAATNAASDLLEILSRVEVNEVNVNGIKDSLESIVFTCEACAHGCDANKTSCICNKGYELAENDLACLDIDECETEPCLDGQKCKNTMGSYECLEHKCELVRKTKPDGTAMAECACNNGFLVNQDFICLDIDECTLNNPCNENSVCSNSRGSYNCTCKQGFERQDKNNCVDINECTTGLHNCTDGHICVNTAGSFRCDCPSGYRLLSNGTCQDIDECKEQKINCVTEYEERTDTEKNLQCVNTPGSHHCGCNKGHKKTSERQYKYIRTRYYSRDYRNIKIEKCIDVDECNPRTECKDPGMTCTNKVGGFTCGCKLGWSKANGTCFKKDCHGATSNAGDCDCPTGFEMDRSNFEYDQCVDVNECTASGCSEGNYCINTFGSHVCIPAACPSGFTKYATNKFWCTNDAMSSNWCRLRPGDCIKRFKGAMTLLHSFVSINPNVKIEEPLFTIEGLKNISAFEFTLREATNKSWFELDGPSLRLVTPLDGPQVVSATIDVMNQVPYVGVVHTAIVHIYVKGPKLEAMPNITSILDPELYQVPEFKHFDGQKV